MVHQGDHQTGRSISFNVLNRTVHGTEKTGFLLDLVSSFLRFSVCDRTRIQIGIDSHLFTGHGIQRKSGSYFCYSFRTFIDYHKLNHN